jgi:hypothetical protein
MEGKFFSKIESSRIHEESQFREWIISILSTLSILVLAIFFVPSALTGYTKNPPWVEHLVDVLFLYIPGYMSGALINFILWFRIITKFRPRDFLYRVANMEMIIMLTITYAACLAEDYFTFIMAAR